MAFGFLSPETTSNATDSRTSQDGALNKLFRGNKANTATDSGVVLAGNAKVQSGLDLHGLTLQKGSSLVIGDTSGAERISKQFSDTLLALNQNQSAAQLSLHDDLQKVVTESLASVKDLADNKQSDGLARVQKAFLWIALAICGVWAFKIWRQRSA